MTQPFYQLPGDIDQDIENFAADVERFQSGDLAAGIFKSRRVPRGIYEQRQNGTYMVRIRASAGRLTPDQVRKIAELGVEYSDGRLHVTTRLDVQLHNVDIADTPAIMRGLREVGLSAKGGGGNTVRNITACPFAGVCPTEAFDVAPFAHAVTEYLITLPGSYNLPRKYKIAFSGCGEDCSLARANDLGLFPELRDGQTGFRIYVGGGMGSKSRIGDLLEEWVPSTEIIRIAEAIRRIFDRLGDRQNRSRARLRFVLERLGIEEFRRIYQEELTTVTAEGVPACDVQVTPRQIEDHAVPLPNVAVEVRDGLRVVEENDQAASVKLHLPLGYIQAHAFGALGEIAEEFAGDGVLRTTQSQDLLLCSVPTDRLPALGEKISALALDVDRAGSLSQFVACAGSSTCRLGLCLSRGAADAAAKALDAAGLSAETVAELRFNLSGCPNACGQHPVASVGFFGVAIRQGGRLLPAYRVVMGAKVGTEDAQLGERIGTVPARRLPEFVVALARDFEELRGLREPFASYVTRQGTEYLSKLLQPFATVGEYDQQPDAYRDWGRDEDFSLAGRGAGECGAGVFEVIRDDLALAKKSLEHGAPLWEVLLPTIRALLITRGVDDKAPDKILAAFREHFVGTGLVDGGFSPLLKKANAAAAGNTEAVAESGQEIRGLLARVELLFSTLDGNLQFHPPEAEEALETEQETAASDGASVEELDLRGVACPMNFVKTKLKLETMSAGAVLDVILDDGEPVQNVPASLREEGHEVPDLQDIGDGLWRIRVIKSEP